MRWSRPPRCVLIVNFPREGVVRCIDTIVMHPTGPGFHVNSMLNPYLCSIFSAFPSFVVGSLDPPRTKLAFCILASSGFFSPAKIGAYIAEKVLKKPHFRRKLKIWSGTYNAKTINKNSKIVSQKKIRLILW